MSSWSLVPGGWAFVVDDGDGDTGLSVVVGISTGLFPGDFFEGIWEAGAFCFGARRAFEGGGGRGERTVCGWLRDDGNVDFLGFREDPCVSEAELDGTAAEEDDTDFKHEVEQVGEDGAVAIGHTGSLWNKDM